MFATLRAPAIVAIASLTIAGCSGTDMFGSSGASDVTTSSLTTQQQTASRVDPACGPLALEIDNLRREGIADKIDRAAAKKYRMTAADLTKANQLTKANADFQAKCSTLPRTAAAPAAPAAQPASVGAVQKAATPAVAKAAAPAAAAVATQQ